MPFLSPDQQCQNTEGKIPHSMDLLTPSSRGDIPTLSLITNSSWLPWRKVVMTLISPLMPVPQCIFILHIKNWHEQKETPSETVSDSRFVINVDSVYCTVFLYISDSICSFLHCALAVAQCIVIGSVCLCVGECVGESVTIIKTWTCLHRSSLNSVCTVGIGSDHLQLIKFGMSHAPRKGLCSGANILGSALLQPACSVCVSSERFFHYIHTCSVCFVIIKICFIVAVSYPFFGWHKW